MRAMAPRSTQATREAPEPAGDDAIIQESDENVSVIAVEPVASVESDEHMSVSNEHASTSVSGPVTSILQPVVSVMSVEVPVVS